ncbi:glycosyltransferase [Rubrivirga sp. IMCC43871]|uniref:glycosyltransferase n=1 Tax=Rubrivirga sp. IMCC43871 TaxID=3391575 RepID=UPI00398FE894
MSVDKKILLIMPYGGVGGIERLVKTFYTEYVSRGYVVSVVKIIKRVDDVVSFGDDEIYLSEIDLYEMNIIKRTLFYIKSPFRIRRYINNLKITHSIAFGDVANLFSCLTFTREFKVASIHSLKSSEFEQDTLLNRVSRFAYRHLYGAFGRVVCISKGIHDDVVDNCGYKFTENLSIIYNPHDIDLITERADEAVSEEEEVAFERPAVAFVGRLSDEKAPWRLVRAFAHVVRSGVDCNLVFIGDGSPAVLDRLQALALTKGISDRVFFLGRKENPYKLLARSSALALTSRFEGTPNVIVEAIALGVPVVSSYCTQGIAELMSVAGLSSQTVDSVIEVEGGLITPHYTERLDAEQHPLDETFAVALRQVLGDPRHRERVKRARMVLLAKFDATTSTDRYIDSGASVIPSPAETRRTTSRGIRTL